MTIFLENTRIFRERYEDLADALEEVSVDGLDWCETRRGQRNLCEVRGGKRYYYHSNYDAEKEAERWWRSLDLKGAKVLYIYGLGAGYSYRQVASWLQEDRERYLVYLEDDFRVLKRFFELDEAKEVLCNPQVLWGMTGGKNQAQTDSVCFDLAVYLYGLPLCISALPYYEVQRSLDHQRVQVSVMHHTAYVRFTGSESLEYGASFFSNFYRNVLRLGDCVGCEGLWGKFQGVPAVICGAGPSLNKNFSILQELSDRAVIFAGGSAINALTSRGLMPHFGGSVDPNFTQCLRMMDHSGYALPMFIKTRMHYKAMEVLQGPFAYLAGNTGYPITGWMEKRLGIREKHLPEGHNVLHLLINLATHMGCNPILFVGIDLAYTGLQSYAEGIVGNAEVKKEEVIGGRGLDDNAFGKKDIYGKPIYTLWKWVGESQFTSRYVQKHPQTTFVNCTEGGIGFEGVDNRPLKEMAETYLTSQYDIPGRIHSCLQEARFSSIQQGDVSEVLREIYESIERCEGIFRDQEKIIGTLEKSIRKGRKKELQKASEEMDSCQAALHEEVGYKEILEPSNEMRSVLYERRFEQAGHRHRRCSETERLLEHCENQREELQSLCTGAVVHRTILRECLRSHEEYGFASCEWLEEKKGEEKDG